MPRKSGRYAALALACLLGSAAHGCGGDDPAGRDTTGSSSRFGPNARPSLTTPSRGGAAASFSSAPGTLPLAGSGVVPISNESNTHEGGVCASAVVQTAKTMPTVVFVIDGSGSMCAPFGGATRWQALRSALLDPMRGLVYRLQSSVSFGAVLYDGTLDIVLGLLPAPGQPMNPQCSLAYAEQKQTGNCPGLVEVMPPAIMNAPAIDMAYPQTELGGSTPTDKAMKHVMDALLAQVQVQGPDQRAVSPVYVILATDGAPNDICVGGAGGDGSAQRAGVLAAVDQGAAAGITTWVISLADGNAQLQTHLDEVARHGDPANPNAHTFVPTNPDELIQTLAQLLGGAVGCDINLDGRVTVGAECSGSVRFQGEGLPCCQQTGPDQWACDGQPAAAPNGWHLTAESSIALVGDACTNFLLATETTLTATFPCDVFTPL